MADHSCVIGLLHGDYSDTLATVEILKDHIKDTFEYNKSIDEDPVLRTATFLKHKQYTFSCYGDWRFNTDLTRFRYCPECGREIDWKAIKRIDFR